jgi:probable rRNA maturation factor
MAEQMLRALELGDAELSVLITDDERIRTLNREHRGKDRPTDVLSFPMDPDAASAPGRLLGDVVISLDTALRQARGRRRDLVAELRFLLAHGLLHLLGYDHATASEKKRMVKATRRLVRAAEQGPPVVRHPKKPSGPARSKGRRRLASRNHARARHAK